MIIGGRITSLNATKKKDEPIEGLNININLDDVKVDAGKVKVGYTCTIDYQKEVASIEVKGEMFLEEDEATVKKIEEEWKKKKRLPQTQTEDLITSINYSSSAVGTLASFALGINAPINVPRARLLQQPESTSSGKAKAG